MDWDCNNCRLYDGMWSVLRLNMIILFQNFYLNQYRKKEILFCLDQNLKNKYIDCIYLFVGNEQDVPVEYRKHKKLRIMSNRTRPTFEVIFETINNLVKYKIFKENDIFILANTDVFFERTLSQAIDFVDWDDHVWALTRWEFDGKKHSRYIGWDYSQDAWIWRGVLNTKNMQLNFPMGKPGCDNRLAYELSKNYNVINPCKSVWCHHYHLNRYRGYTPGNPTETIPEPYLRVEPIKL